MNFKFIDAVLREKLLIDAIFLLTWEIWKFVRVHTIYE